MKPYSDIPFLFSDLARERDSVVNVVEETGDGSAGSRAGDGEFDTNKVAEAGEDLLVGEDVVDLDNRGTLLEAAEDGSETTDRRGSTADQRGDTADQ